MLLSSIGGLVAASLLLAWTTGASSMWTFVAAIAAIVPLAESIRRATDHLARRAGPAIGGLLNVSFGNTAELVLALNVLSTGNTEVVKAQITGSIIGNGLLGLGLAIVAGTVGRATQTFNRARAGQLSSLLVLSMIALLIPAIFDYTVRGGASRGASAEEPLSVAVAAVLIVVYAANLAYTQITHRTVFALKEGKAHDASASSAWPVSTGLLVLAGATVLTTVEAHFVSTGIESTASALSLSEFFLGVVVLAIVGNAPEYIAGVYFARQGQMGLAVSITIGSSIQVALLVAPLLVLVSAFTAHPMNLVFTSPLELIAIAAVTFAVNAVARDGETTWFEGVMLLAIYVLLAIAFYFL
jgi:Ca2+:H+ antiporter